MTDQPINNASDKKKERLESIQKIGSQIEAQRHEYDDVVEEARRTLTAFGNLEGSNLTFEEQKGVDGLIKTTTFVTNLMVGRNHDLPITLTVASGTKETPRAAQPVISLYLGGKNPTTLLGDDAMEKLSNALVNIKVKAIRTGVMPGDYIKPFVLDKEKADSQMRRATEEICKGLDEITETSNGRFTYTFAFGDTKDSPAPSKLIRTTDPDLSISISSASTAHGTDMEKSLLLDKPTISILGDMTQKNTTSDQIQYVLRTVNAAAKRMRLIP